MSYRRVLVVGTTSDYIDIIDRRFPKRALFITDRRERAKAFETPPDADSELLCDLTKPEEVLAALKEHLKNRRIEPSGIACFDCESMPLSARIAEEPGLRYPSPQAISACRSKYASKLAWRRAKLPCPEVRLVESESDAMAFFRRTGGPVVLKPLTGSGSELVFMCSSEAECLAAFIAMQSALADHPDRRLYAPYLYDGKKVDPRKVFVIEEFISGPEYSCDFVVDNGKVEILRIAGKNTGRWRRLRDHACLCRPDAASLRHQRKGFQRSTSQGSRCAWY